MRVVIGQLSHETNTFLEETTDLSFFEAGEWEIKETLLANHTGVQDYLGGMIESASEENIEILPALSALASPSGLIEKDTYTYIKKVFLQECLQYSNVDAYCLALHGAGVVEGIDDLEGGLLQTLRKEIGGSKPIVVTLDLHANVTEEMAEHADILLSIKEYPHIDTFATGKKAMQLTSQMIEKKIKPVMHMEKLPLLIPTFTTMHEPARELVRTCRRLEKLPDVLDCSFIHGFPYADVKSAGVSVICITDADNILAEETAITAASAIWQVREQFFLSFFSPKEGVETAASSSVSPVIINETSDNPGAGTPGDGTFLLKEMLEKDIKNSCFGVINDPEVVQLAHEAGVGEYIECSIGAKIDNKHGRPLQIKGYVKSLTDGKFIQSSAMWKGMKRNIGKTARLQIGNVDVIVCSRRAQVFDDQIFLLHGIDVSACRTAGLKSSHHFRDYYSTLAASMITVDSPGLSTNNLFSFSYQHIRPSMYPFKETAAYSAFPTNL